MSNELSKQKLPTIAELYDIDNIDKAFKEDQFNLIMNGQPKKEWVQQNKYANNSNYIPIGVIETLLQKIFKNYKVEVLREGVMFNSVYCTVRLHLLHPVTNEWYYFDGCGAMEIQTKAGASPAELDKINKNAVQMALPASKSYAIKDAAENIGALFGRDLNRKETMAFMSDKNIEKAVVSKETKRKFILIESAKTLEQLHKNCQDFKSESTELEEAYRIKFDELKMIDDAK